MWTVMKTAPAGIGRVVRMIRASVGMSQVDFAERCDLQQVTIRRIERGASNPNDSTLRKIEGAFGIPDDYLVRIALWGRLDGVSADVVQPLVEAGALLLVWEPDVGEEPET